MATLNSESPVPLYYQLRKFITDRIDSGAWQPGDRLPSESELRNQFGISRTTVRQALGELTSQGLLTRIQGKGTFVAQPRIQQRLTQLTGFTQDMHARRLRPSSRVLDLRLVEAGGRVAEVLGLKPGEEVVLLRRLRLADKEPMAVETAYLLGSFYSALQGENLGERSLYDVLRQKCGAVPTRAVQQIEAIACPALEARLLGVRKGTPVLHMHRTSYDPNHHPIEQVESFYRGDRYIFHAELSHKLE
jgi:GntR family transcriptional regulator